uniref:Uncharacterized protein AlNc14C408G11432 n=1 Tax=Albugo laibachii Nc14 TaxID=890382 RepID=F0WZ23_9STRA|nr:conserved hypothetical protein [Albugo laibachii Nc14]|eukprot:CCA26738.1 conserved hypothetical protein [Albugo laibachii Nc14]
MHPSEALSASTGALDTNNRLQKLLDLLHEEEHAKDGSIESEFDEKLREFYPNFHSRHLTTDTEEDADDGKESTPIDPSRCVECNTHISQVFCEQCHDYFCELCFSGQHRKGKRRLHTIQPCVPATTFDGPKKVETGGRLREDAEALSSNEYTEAENSASESSLYRSNSSRNICNMMGSLLSLGRHGNTSSNLKQIKGSACSSAQNVLERAKFIPLRLTYEERKLLRTLEAALSISQYTDHMDTLECVKNPSKRIRLQLQHIFGFLTGIVMASHYQVGQSLLDEKDFQDKEKFFQNILELGRRYKIMNPERMRGEYGKLMYLLQDAADPGIQELLGISLHQKIKTVYDVLERGNALQVLSDSKIEIATTVVTPEGKTRSQIQKLSRAKDSAIKEIVQKYVGDSSLNEDTIYQCLYSITDNNYHLYFERDPIDRMIQLLHQHFGSIEHKHSNSEDEIISLAIARGQDGARLSHSHKRQFHYVLQSLTLWREISHDMFRLWYLTDQDLLSGTNEKYQLIDTGQGIHRIQPAPLVSRAMHVILHETQRRLGLESWVGSSVIHLGDKNVPNALMFIDKYTQIGYILRPIVKTIDKLQEMTSPSRNLLQYIDTTYGGIPKLQKEILADFFREAFDGSGGDNFFDAGSCIDGRLTSAWNWCSNLHRKPFFPVFQLAGFVGFDGKFA